MNSTRKALLVLGSVLIAASANAGTVQLKQNLNGLDLSVVMVPPDDPELIYLKNKTNKLVVCTGNFTGADATLGVTATIKPGKSTTARIPGTYTDLPRTAVLTCQEKKPSTK